MRVLTDYEREVVLQLAARIASDAERNQLIADLDHCTVEATVPDGSILRVAIEHYQRPSGHGRGLYRAKDDSEVTGVVKDADGAEMEVLLLADANHRLWDIEIVRYHPGSLLKPDWSTFRIK